MTIKTLASFVLALLLTALITTAAEARHHPRGLICGATQMAHYGITDPKYRRALAWPDMPHVSAQPGAVVVQYRNGRDSAGHQGGHVSRIVEMKGQCRAIVADERGQYERDICSRLVAYVMPGGNPGRSKHASYSAITDRHSTQ